jgi:hypothetical protein
MIEENAKSLFQERDALERSMIPPCISRATPPEPAPQSEQLPWDDPPPRFSSAGIAESQKPALPWLGQGPLRLIYLELKTVRNEVNENPKKAE